MSELDRIFEGVTARITSDVPTHNYLVRIENGAQLKQELKEFMYQLGEKHIDNPKGRTKWRREIAKL